jgi:hypothetical protein
MSAAAALTSSCAPGPAAWAPDDFAGAPVGVEAEEAGVAAAGDGRGGAFEAERGGREGDAGLLRVGGRAPDGGDGRDGVDEDRDGRYAGTAAVPGGIRPGDPALHGGR